MIIKYISLFFKVNWVKTILFNLQYFEWKQARKLPVFIYGPSHYSGSGRYILPDKLVTGMIKLGIKHESCCVIKQGIHLINNGLIKFGGAGILGNGSSISVKRGACFQIGKNFGITGHFSVHCAKAITLGNNFSCSWSVSISDTDHHLCLNPETNEHYAMVAPIIVGDNVWCCQHVIISKGTRIPKFTTIAQSSLCNKEYNTSPYSVLAGIPAKSITKKLLRQDIALITELSDSWMITSGIRVFNNIR